jgi:crossover junction endodeoxyribonuclease RuvC
MRILGIDPGSVATGFGVVERTGARATHVAHGTLRPVRSAPLPERLAFLHREVERLIATHRPDLAVIERVFAGRSVAAALVLGQARGAVLAALAAAALPIREVAPQEVKLAVTGQGGAEKAQVQAMVRRLLALAATPPRDAADALAAALCCAQEGRLALLAHTAARGSRKPRRAESGMRVGRIVVRRVP